MTRNTKLIAATGVVCAGLAAGLYAGFKTGSSVPATLTVGQTLAADRSTFVDTPKAVTLIDTAKIALCKTTITGVDYFGNYTQYVGGQWFVGLSNLTLAQAISPTKDRYDTAGNALMKTTITGKQYCLNPHKWSNGSWATAFSTLETERADLVANPKTDGPSITVK